MSIIQGFFDFLSSLKDSSLGKILIGLSLVVLGGILTLTNPDGSAFDPFFELIDRFDLIWIIVFVVGLLVLIVGIVELLKEVEII